GFKATAATDTDRTVIDDNTRGAGVRGLDLSPDGERHVEVTRLGQPDDRRAGVHGRGDDQLAVGLQGQAAHRVDSLRPERNARRPSCSKVWMEVAWGSRRWPGPEASQGEPPPPARGKTVPSESRRARELV